MTFRTLALSTAFAALVTGMAAAQDTTTAPTGAEGAMTEAPAMAPTFSSIEEMTVGDVIGLVTYDPEGNAIGEIDYVVEMENGPAGVIGIGGFIGLGEYTVAIPLSDFNLREDGRSFELATDKETLKTHTEFDETGVESLPDDTRIADLLAADDGGMSGEGTMTDDGSMSDAGMDSSQ